MRFIITRTFPGDLDVGPCGVSELRLHRRVNPPAKLIDIHRNDSFVPQPYVTDYSISTYLESPRRFRGCLLKGIRACAEPEPALPNFTFDALRSGTSYTFCGMTLLRRSRSSLPCNCSGENSSVAAARFSLGTIQHYCYAFARVLNVL